MNTNSKHPAPSATHGLQPTKQHMRVTWREKGHGILQHTETFTCEGTRLLASQIIGKKATEKRGLGHFPVTVELVSRVTHRGPGKGVTA